MKHLMALSLTLVLFACSNQETSARVSVAEAAPAASAAQQRIAITADGNGFSPSSVELKVGSPAVLVFTRTSDETCATAVAFPDLNIKQDLPLNKPVEVSIPTTTPRSLTFTCGMGMYKSTVVVR